MDNLNIPPGIAVEEGSDFQQALRGLRQRLIDLDGDGVPDVVATQPPGPVNAHAEFPAIRQQANAMMAPVQPDQPEEPQGSGLRGWAEQYSGTGLLPTVAHGAFKAYDSLPDMSGVTNNAMTKYLGRSAQALARIPGGMTEMGPGDFLQAGMNTAAAFGATGGIPRAVQSASNAMRAPAVERAAVTGNWTPIQQASRARETSIKQAPPHTLQTRNARGQFQKLEGETRELRDAAIRERAWTKANADRISRMNERAN